MASFLRTWTPSLPLMRQQQPPRPQHYLSSSSQTPPPQQPQSSEKSKSTTPDSTDWIASSITRRFGLGAGLGWAAFLAVGVVSEQIKTRLEVSQQLANTRNVENGEEVVLPNGIRYYDMRVGGGAAPKKGDLVVLDLKGEADGKVFVDTFVDKKKAMAMVMGSRPYSKGMCEGIEYVLRSMRAGSKRRVIVPPAFGFGQDGAELGDGLIVPPYATLEYIVEVDRVSIAPA